MCGIVGILGKEPVALNIVEALRRLVFPNLRSSVTAPSGVLGSVST